MLAELGRSSNPCKEAVAFWKEHKDDALVLRFFGAIRHSALEHVYVPVVLSLDEIDAILSLSFSNGVIGAAFYPNGKALAAMPPSTPPGMRATR